MTETQPQDNKGFYIALFDIDGEHLETNFVEFENFSSKWINVCKLFISSHLPASKDSWGGQLSHISTRITSQHNSAIVTFFIQEYPVLSMALAKGISEEIERHVLAMFVNSLRKIDIVENFTNSSEPFKEIISITERPLMIIIPWPSKNISDKDIEAVNELSNHFAAAYFLLNNT